MRIILVLLSMTLLSCGDEGGRASDDGSSEAETGPTTVDEFRSELPGLLCGKIGACCAQTPVPSCEADVTATLDGIFGGLTETVVFDPNEATRCLGALRRVPEGCLPLVEASAIYRPACSAVIHGTVQPGEICAGAQECQNPPGAQGNTATGFSGCAVLGGEGNVTRCRRFNQIGNVGDACERGFEGTESEVNLCLPTLSCSDNKLCENKPTLGQLCPQNDCVESVCEAGVCVEGAALGESCEADRCANDLVCDELSKCSEQAPSDAYVGVCLGFGCVDSVCPQ